MEAFAFFIGLTVRRAKGKAILNIIMIRTSLKMRLNLIALIGNKQLSLYFY
jgi:hypothetical protein